MYILLLLEAVISARMTFRNAFLIVSDITTSYESKAKFMSFDLCISFWEEKNLFRLSLRPIFLHPISQVPWFLGSHALTKVGGALRDSNLSFSLVFLLRNHTSPALMGTRLLTCKTATKYF